jgi:hypothetical protein
MEHFHLYWAHANVLGLENNVLHSQKSVFGSGEQYSKSKRTNYRLIRFVLYYLWKIKIEKWIKNMKYIEIDK